MRERLDIRIRKHQELCDQSVGGVEQSWVQIFHYVLEDGEGGKRQSYAQIQEVRNLSAHYNGSHS